MTIEYNILKFPKFSKFLIKLGSKNWMAQNIYNRYLLFIALVYIYDKQIFYINRWIIYFSLLIIYKYSTLKIFIVYNKEYMNIRNYKFT